MTANIQKQPFITLQGRGVPLNLNNVDTDQIIPARFLKGTVKSGLGQHLFCDWRYDGSGAPKEDFPLNQPQYKGAPILVAAHNFGCGSSREHAPWALTDYGFKAILAVSFADIFKNNALKNQLLPVALPEAHILSLLSLLEQDPSVEIAIDLPTQTVQWAGQPPLSFEIDPFRKTCLLEGLDDIGYTLGHVQAIDAYEAALK
jgi:3-isopropylmalate/(R)-2-methylmalate dehydratase small subunit